ncbi:MAG TPA: hypothetical protein VII12_03440 [Thermoanaerobaculia bacterium]|jgi:hypothetical protein
MHDSFVWIPIVGTIVSFGTVVAIVWLVTRGKQRRAQMRADVQMRLIDKFGSSAEFVHFLESPAGQQFLEQPRRQTRERALGAITGALICTFIGLAFLGCAFIFGDPGFYVPAFILTGIGIALFISSAISWRMTKQWNGTQPPPGISATSS